MLIRNEDNNIQRITSDCISYYNSCDIESIEITGLGGGILCDIELKSKQHILTTKPFTIYYIK